MPAAESASGCASPAIGLQLAGQTSESWRTYVEDQGLSSDDDLSEEEELCTIFCTRSEGQEGQASKHPGEDSQDSQRPGVAIDTRVESGRASKEFARLRLPPGENATIVVDSSMVPRPRAERGTMLLSTTMVAFLSLIHISEPTRPY